MVVSLGILQNQSRLELHRSVKVGFGAIGGFSFGGLANLRQAGMPGCLSEALYQLTQSESSQEGLRMSL